MTQPRRFLTAAAIAAAFLGAAATCPARAAGLDIHDDASAADVGLPVYPGAVKQSDEGDHHSAVSFGLWGGSFGMKVAVVRYRSADGVEAVASFYRDALAKVGPVLDCSQNKTGKKHDHDSDGAHVDLDSHQGDGARPVTCGDDDPEPGGRLYKAGTKADQRAVDVKPLGRGATFELVRVELRGTD